MAPGREVATKIRVVVDLAIEDDPAGIVLVGHGLVAASTIDNRQPPVPEGHAIVGEKPGPIRPTVCQRIGHRADRRPERGRKPSLES
jgi:hypothetical protein